MQLRGARVCDLQQVMYLTYFIPESYSLPYSVLHSPSFILHSFLGQIRSIPLFLHSPYIFIHFLVILAPLPFPLFSILHSLSKFTGGILTLKNKLKDGGDFPLTLGLWNMASPVTISQQCVMQGNDYTYCVTTTIGRVLCCLTHTSCHHHLHHHHHHHSAANHRSTATTTTTTTFDHFSSYAHLNTLSTGSVGGEGTDKSLMLMDGFWHCNLPSPTNQTHFLVSINNCHQESQQTPKAPEIPTSSASC